MYKYIIALLLISVISSCSEKQQEEQTNTEEKKACCEEDETTTQETSGKKVSSESIFLLADNFVTQNGEDFKLSQLKGRPTVIGMIFTHCAYACPRLTSDIMGISGRLGKLSNDVNFVLVSFDIKRDSPERLKAYAAEMDLPDNWILLCSNEDAVRTMSVLLNVQYEELEDGNFNHSNIVSVLNNNGELVFQVEGLEANQDGTIDTIKEILSK
ncbi:MAG: SCO family protein [Chitinophagaceae bacterium]|nr:SCO family protein [Chitinophagaceae bacterium]MCB0698362.1 SCO family protein [Chitinophagaceae bacterium]